MTDVAVLLDKAMRAVGNRLNSDDSSEDEGADNLTVSVANKMLPSSSCPKNRTNKYSDDSSDDDSAEISVDVSKDESSVRPKKRRRNKTHGNSVGLSCTLQHGIADPLGGMYVDDEGNARMSGKYLQSLAEVDQRKSSTKSCEELAKETPSVRQGKRERRLERQKTKGKDWFNLPAPVMTDELKNDLTVLQMRKALDPKRFYKGPDIRGALPKYFQMGRIVETPADYYSGRIPKKQQKKTLVDELLADVDFRRYNKRKYDEIQAKQPRAYNKAYKHMKKLKKNRK